MIIRQYLPSCWDDKTRWGCTDGRPILASQRESQGGGGQLESSPVQVGGKWSEGNRKYVCLKKLEQPDFDLSGKANIHTDRNFISREFAVGSFRQEKLEINFGRIWLMFRNYSLLVDTTTWLVLSGTGHSLNSDCLHPIYSFSGRGHWWWVNKTKK